MGIDKENREIGQKSKNPPYKLRKTGIVLVAGEGFEPSKAEPGDLQSPPIGRSGNPPGSNMCCGFGTTSGKDTLGT